MATYKKYKLKPKKSIDGKTLKPEERWMVKGYLGIDPKTGLDKYTTLRGFETKRSASDAYEDAVYEFKHGKYEKVVKPTIREAYEMWFPLHKDLVRPSTQQSIQQQFRLHILPEFGDYFVDQLTLLDIQPWLNRLNQKYRSVSVIFGRLKLLMKFCGSMGWITNDPTSMATVPRTNKAKSNHPDNNFYSIEELNLFSAALDREAQTGGKQGIERLAFFRVLISTGMRCGEAQALTWDDVNFSARTISINKTALPDYGEGEHVGEPKTKNAYRTLKVGEDVLRALMLWRNNSKPSADGRRWIFVTQYGKCKRVGHELPKYWIKGICKRNNLRRITLHGLRHTKATLMVEANINPADIAGTLGHANPEFTMSYYVHNTQDGINNASDEYEKLLQKVIWSKSGHKNENSLKAGGM
ncbi:tyrosine-type recombinase/integrase [Lacticaseibacillus sp. N501-2]|uniref:tyrosine-type recombinase/integrase n=1 Tax=Lacticaseibacillus salsurae TaxID=3367729 RepID=UPI0038B27467